MSALIKKEIRLLLPAWASALVLQTILPWMWFWHDPASAIARTPFVFFFGMTILSVISFGRELSLGTFPELISLPVSRSQIWRTKILSLFGLSLLVFLAYETSCWLRFHQAITDLNSVWHFNALIFQRDFFYAMEASIAVMFVALAGGLWTTLLLRQITAAFWIAILTPAALLMLIAFVISKFFSSASDTVVFSILYGAACLYFLTSFFFARWLFFRAQDLQWSGGTIVMPEMRGLARFKSFAGGRRNWRPRAALWRKEFQLHQSQFVMAFVLIVLHIGVLVTRKVGNFRPNSDTKFILESFWFLWLVMPLLVGCAAVSEERKLGTLAGQLCLPAKRRTQFAIKFIVALGLSIFLGAVMPLLLEGSRALPKIHFDIGGLQQGWQFHLSTAQSFLVDCIGTFITLLPVLTLVGIAALIGLVSFYASSLARNTLQTLAPAVLGIIVIFFLLISAESLQRFYSNLFWHGPLHLFVGLPLTLLALLALAYRNFRQLSIGWKMVARNLTCFALALVVSIAATAVVYHRVWEKLTPFEPLHGAAKLSLANPPQLTVRWGEVSVRLPDGKIWTASYLPGSSALNPLSALLANLKVNLSKGEFIQGSNWLAVNHVYREWVGIKTDGTLWVSEEPQHNDVWKITEQKAKNLVQFDNETNWNSIGSFSFFSFLVKNDGTLWRWGDPRFDSQHKQWPGLRTFTPELLGAETNWAEVFREANSQLLFRKTDGTVWTWGDYFANTNGRPLINIAPGLTLTSFGNLASHRFSSTTQITWQFKAGVRDDGTFRIWAEQRLNSKKNHSGSYEWFPTDVQIGTDTNWLAVASDGEKIVTLKNDGTLWLWNFSSRRAYFNPDEQEILNTKPVRLGTHTDWIAISGNRGDLTALAADGSLWFWPLEREDYYSGNGNHFIFYDDGSSHFSPLLDISHKPQFLGNVFGRAN